APDARRRGDRVVGGGSGIGCGEPRDPAVRSGGNRPVASRVREISHPVCPVESGMSVESVVIGIDVGTQGARVVAHDSDGTLVASEAERFVGDWSGPEQQPDEWWSAVAQCSRRLTVSLGDREIAGVSVTSTSGTVVPLDAAWQPLAPALMYSDRRAADV